MSGKFSGRCLNNLSFARRQDWPAEYREAAYPLLVRHVWGRSAAYPLLVRPAEHREAAYPRWCGLCGAVQ